MYFFIAVIFIAELIITGFIINLIWQADKKICAINEQVLVSTVQLKKVMANVRKNVHTLETGVNVIINYVHKKRNEYIFKIIKTLMIYAIILIIETRFYKIKKFKKIAGVGNALLKGFLA